MAQLSAYPFEWIVLALGVLAFGGFGVLFLVAFEPVAAKLGIQTSATGRIDLVAIYVGFELGFAGFLGMCAFRDGWLEAGLLASGFAFAGFGAARALAMAMHRAGVVGLLWLLLAAEAAGATLSFVAASRVG